MEASQQPRGECPIVKLTRESHGGWGVVPAAAPLAGVVGARGRAEVLDSSASVVIEGGGEAAPRLRFGIVLMCDEGMWPKK